MAVSARLAEPAAESVRADPPVGRRALVVPMPADRLWGWLGPLIITVFAGFLRFNRLSIPPTKAFDEIYYAHDSWSLLQHGVEVSKGAPEFIAHPPLGKWAIAGGEVLFGNNSLGWRFSAAVFGTVGVLLTARIARRLFRSTLVGCIAGLLVALDGLEFVESRASLLDIFLMVWCLAAFGAVLLDRDRTRARWADGRGSGGRPWLWAAGFCLGAACATKWSGIYYLGALVVLTLVWDAGGRRALGRRSPWRFALARDLPQNAAAQVGLAAVVYTVSWTGWFASDGAHAYGHDTYTRGVQGTVGHAVAVVHGWFHYQAQIWHFHETLTAHHTYQSHPIGWLFLARPVSYYYESRKYGTYGCHAREGCSQALLAIGTPALWWASVGAILLLLWVWLGRRDWRAGAVLLMIAAGIVTWMWSDLRNRTEFFFYALPSLPFLAMAVAMSCGWALGGPAASRDRRRWGAALVAVYLLLVLADFAWLYPVLATKVIPYTAWRARMWLPSWI